MLTILVYLLALFAALIGGIVGVLIMAGLMFRFHSYTSANTFDYRIEPLEAARLDERAVAPLARRAKRRVGEGAEHQIL